MDDTMTVATTIGVDGNTVEASEGAPDKLRLNVTEARMKGLKVGTLRKANEGNITGLLEFVGHFVTDDSGAYLDNNQAVALLDDLTLEQLEAVAEQLNKTMEDAAVPKG